MRVLYATRRSAHPHIVNEPRLITALEIRNRIYDLAIEDVLNTIQLPAPGNIGSSCQLHAEPKAGLVSEDHILAYLKPAVNYAMKFYPPIRVASLSLFLCVIFPNTPPPPSMG